MNRTNITVAFLTVLALAGCMAPYDERMAYLDTMTERGIEYRTQLQEQGTAPTREACEIGYDLLGPAGIPRDRDGATTSQWQDQVKEAYLKGCMTGQPRPKPDPGGVDAVTPVPHSTTTPAPASPS